MVRAGGGDGGASLNWRPAADLVPAWTDPHELGPQVAQTELDGDWAGVYGEDGYVVVVGPVKQGRFLTLSVTGHTVDEVVALATHVHRQ
ncbi:MAG: hypothetical protein R2731_09615 [Nocardioides sp.]